MPSVNVNQGGNLKPSIPFEAAEQRSMWRGRPRPLPPSDLPVFASELLVLLLPCSRRTVILTTRGGLSCCENHRVSERRQNLSFQWKACFLCSSLREKKKKKNTWRNRGGGAKINQTHQWHVFAKNVPPFFPGPPPTRLLSDEARK